MPDRRLDSKSKRARDDGNAVAAQSGRRYSTSISIIMTPDDAQSAIIMMLRAMRLPFACRPTSLGVGSALQPHDPRRAIAGTQLMLSPEIASGAYRRIWPMPQHGNTVPWPYRIRPLTYWRIRGILPVIASLRRFGW